jgi:hypothetical protein
MAQRGRKSAAQLLIQNINPDDPPRLSAPAGLNAKERALFCEIINGSDPKHFRKNEVDLLVSYVQAVLMAREAVRKHEINTWEKAVRVQLSMAMRLRLAPSTRLDPKTVERQQQYHGPAPWDQKEDEA